MHDISTAVLLYLYITRLCLITTIASSITKRGAHVLGVTAPTHQPGRDNISDTEQSKDSGTVSQFGFSGIKFLAQKPILAGNLEVLP